MGNAKRRCTVGELRAWLDKGHHHDEQTVAVIEAYGDQTIVLDADPGTTGRDAWHSASDWFDLAVEADEAVPHA